MATLTADFHAAVNHYLTNCAKMGRLLQKPASGRLMLRIRPEVHAAVNIAAQAAGKSINQWANKVLGEAAHV